MRTFGDSRVNLRIKRRRTKANLSKIAFVCAQTSDYLLPSGVKFIAAFIARANASKIKFNHKFNSEFYRDKQAKTNRRDYIKLLFAAKFIV